MRNLTQAAIDEIVKTTIRPVYLFKGHFTGQNICLTTAPFDISFGGDTYLANGWLTAVPTMQETGDIRADGFVVSLVATDPSVITVVLSDNQSHLPGKFYVGFMSIKTGRENILKQSNTLTDAEWTKSNVTVVADGTGPFGGTANKLTASGSSVRHEVYASSYTITQGTRVKFKCYMRRGGNLQYVSILDRAASWNKAVFDLINGTVSATVAAFDAFIRDVGNGWFECGMTFITDDTFFRYEIALEQDGDAVAAPDSWTADGDEHVFIAHCQATTVKNNGGYVETTDTRFLYEGSGQTLVVDPDIRACGRFDGASFVMTPRGANVSLRYESRFITMNRPRIVRYTDEEQKRLFPGDQGLEYSQDVQDWSGFWGVRAGD